jgi:hypothetical protein
MKTILLLFLIPLLSFSQEKAKEKSKDLKLQISESENIELKYNNLFKFKVTKDPDDRFEPALSFSSYKNQFKSLGLKIFLSKDLKKPLKTKKDVEKYLENASKRYATGSVEKKLNIKELKITDSLCFYSSFTDASLQNVTKTRPGQFKNVTIGYLVKEDFIVYFRSYSNSVTDEEFKSALNIVKSISFSKIKLKEK